MKTIARRNRAGFTLTEMLVVIVIIVILAAMLTPVVMSALANAKKTKIRMEMESMASAVKNYKLEMGSYPPSNPANAAAHVTRAYPRATEAAVAFNDTKKALVFWLNGLSPDPALPFTGASKVKFFEFKQEQLDLAALTYRPPIESLRQPYEYTRTSGGFTIESAGLDDIWNTTDDLKVEY